MKKQKRPGRCPSINAEWQRCVRLQGHKGYHKSKTIKGVTGSISNGSANGFETYSEWPRSSRTKIF